MFINIQLKAVQIAVQMKIILSLSYSNNDKIFNPQITKEMTPKFRLRPSASERKTIQMRFYIKGTDVQVDIKNRLGITLKIHSENWNKETQTPQKRIDYNLDSKRDVEIINNVMNKIKIDLDEAIYIAQRENISIDNKYIRNTVNKAMGVEIKESDKQYKNNDVINVSLYDYSINVVDRMEKGIIMNEKSNTKYNKRTVQQYQNFANHLFHFDSTTLMNDINQNWIDRFKDFLTNEQIIRNDKGDIIYSKKASTNSYINNFLKNLGVINKRGLREKITDNDFQKLGFLKRIKSNTNNRKVDVYLTKDEIDKLYNFKFSDDNKSLELVRDNFLIGCYTGLRVSDFKRIKKNDIVIGDNGIKIINLINKKTNKTTNTPIIFDELESILQKYDYEVETVSDQHINRNIKLIAKDAGIDRVVKYVEYIGGEVISKESPKWKLLTNRVGRNSLVTLLKLQGYSDDFIKQFTGHSNLDMLTLYNKATKDEMIFSEIERMKR